jgi:hypothetical protein
MFVIPIKRLHLKAVETETDISLIRFHRHSENFRSIAGTYINRNIHVRYETLKIKHINIDFNFYMQQYSPISRPIRRIL